MANAVVKTAIGLVLVASNVVALEAAALKKPSDKVMNYIIEQYDAKAGQYKGVNADDVVTQAMIVAALGDHFRKYREGHGPWMSEPARAVVNAKTVNDSNAGWLLVATKATHNESYKSKLDQFKNLEKAPAAAALKTSDLAPTAITKEWANHVFWATRPLFEKKAREVEIEGAKVKWAEVLGENLVKLQKPDGSFSDDMQVNALASLLLTHCYRTLKE
jgi:hypothetical protein